MATEVTGTADCRMEGPPTATAGPNGSSLISGAVLTCTISTLDPRVNGTAVASQWTMESWGSASSQAAVEWGSVRLESMGGVWEGKATGVYSADRGDMVATWYKGTGDYAALTYLEVRTGKSPSDIRGLIYPGDPPILASPDPNATGSTPSPGPTASTVPAPTATALAYGPVSVYFGTSAYGDDTNPGPRTGGPNGSLELPSGVYTGTQVANDPRAEFAFRTTSWVIDVWGGIENGMGVQWGTDVRTTAGGGWSCSDSGYYSSTIGDTIIGWCKGTGTYAGLGLFGLATTTDPFDPSVSESSNGMIFPGEPPIP